MKFNHIKFLYIQPIVKIDLKHIVWSEVRGKYPDSYFKDRSSQQNIRTTKPLTTRFSTDQIQRLPPDRQPASGPAGL